MCEAINDDSAGVSFFVEEESKSFGFILLELIFHNSSPSIWYQQKSFPQVSEGSPLFEYPVSCMYPNSRGKHRKISMKPN